MQAQFDNAQVWPNPRSTSSAPQASVPHRVSTGPVLAGSFYLFVFSLPFEGLPLPIPVELTVFTAAAFLLVALCNIRICFLRPPVAFWGFAFFFYACAASGVISGSRVAEEVLYQLVVLAQLLAVFWVTCNLFRVPDLARRSMVVFAISCVLLATLQLTGISELTANIGDLHQRITSFDSNPNTLARMFGLAWLILYGLRASDAVQSVLLRPVLVVLLGVLSVAMVQTGSRGALIALGCGVISLAVHASSPAAKLRGVAAVIVAAATVGFFAFSSPLLQERFEKAASGDLAKRESILPIVVQMVQEKPLLGWGPVTDVQEIGRRLRQPGYDTRDAHNLVLAVLVKAGAFGFIPFLIGLLGCARGAWSGRKGIHGVLPLAMFVLLIAANMSGSWLLNKVHWLVLAFALQAHRYFTERAVAEPGKTR